ncbi:hypothetical protein BDY17DRAFT_52415 [Neohortaea acidophila]|uniref:Uncharacterized protein n=1 Tax=Neohortaea acidophila TaxID=245834 RepID=A0A6A6PGW4_9PEZI|nr:uncharacterized protein BDY17DRAFT_52415 [Neohortaea acidophila]KAF2479229.1 hypothetical protein BDY17DRAFT_52415 [Neohortaea acidophila]
MRRHSAADIDSHHHKIVYEHRDRGPNHHRNLDRRHHQNEDHPPCAQHHHCHSGGSAHIDDNDHRNYSYRAQNSDRVSISSPQPHSLLEIRSRPADNTTQSVPPPAPPQPRPPSMPPAPATISSAPNSRPPTAQACTWGMTQIDPNAGHVSIGEDSVYDCCVACLTGSALNFCQAAYFEAGVCNVYGGDPVFCNNGAGPQALALTITTSTTPGTMVFSNGPCGLVEGVSE